MADFPGMPLGGDESPDLRLPPALPRHEVPVVRATPVSLAGYGVLVDDPNSYRVELVAWPALGWRPVDPGTGLGGGLASARLHVRREGRALLASDDEGRDDPARGWTIVGWAERPDEAGAAGPAVILPGASYRPDGGQLVVPVDPGPYLAVLARPGDDVGPGDFAGFFVEPGRALSIPPGVWCAAAAAIPAGDGGRFLVRSGRVRARISCDLREEFGVVLSVPVRPPVP
ncbi:hypothetical protein OJF2_07090 [Aquisphaera giovannonii]|uniref:Uncharacterized protein n=1 Tax=Aquisphaera giovannonii TaxID=406548 RepID=A0A5B9VX06_9BACT|nr:ureidoglycolate hydrolase [Aquisphaera giovannonii]QEH32240.1 hypothetical protein OJF2_07090 [Aquisphaera giovannonii]